MQRIKQTGLALLLLVILSACSLSATPPEEAAQRITPTLAVTALLPTPEPIATEPSSPTATSLPQSGESSPAISCNPRTDWPLYTVVSGDTLANIARLVNSTTGTLTEANCLANPNMLVAGQHIRVPMLPPIATQPVIIFNQNLPPANLCAAITLPGTIPPLFHTANANEPMNIQLGDWGAWISTVNGFHQITIQTGPTEIVNAFVRTVDVVFQGPACPGNDPPPDEPLAPLYMNVATRSPNVCAAEAGRTGPTLYRTANLNEPIGSLGNWGAWISTVNGFYQITIQTKPTEIVNAFVRMSDVALTGVECP